MKKSTRLMAILLAIITVLSVLPMSALAANSSFTDVPENAWYYEQRLGRAAEVALLRAGKRRSMVISTLFHTRTGWSIQAYIQR